MWKIYLSHSCHNSTKSHIFFITKIDELIGFWSMSAHFHISHKITNFQNGSLTSKKAHWWILRTNGHIARGYIGPILWYFSCKHDAIGKSFRLNTSCPHKQGVAFIPKIPLNLLWRFQQKNIFGNSCRFNRGIKLWITQFFRNNFFSQIFEIVPQILAILISKKNQKIYEFSRLRILLQKMKVNGTQKKK